MQFRIPDLKPQKAGSFNYELVAFRGTGQSQDNLGVLRGDYTCRFSNTNEISSLTLRVRNAVSQPKLDYFINSLSTSLTLVGQEKMENMDAKANTRIEISFILVGLTLNKIYGSSLYDAFDTILEKIQ